MLPPCCGDDSAPREIVTSIVSTPERSSNFRLCAFRYEEERVLEEQSEYLPSLTEQRDSVAEAAEPIAVECPESEAERVLEEQTEFLPSMMEQRDSVAEAGEPIDVEHLESFPDWPGPSLFLMHIHIDRQCNDDDDVSRPSTPPLIFAREYSAIVVEERDSFAEQGPFAVRDRPCSDDDDSSPPDEIFAREFSAIQMEQRDSIAEHLPLTGNCTLLIIRHCMGYFFLPTN